METTKPPLGIMPKWRHDELRLEALEAAIKRYEEAGLAPKNEWLYEQIVLIRTIQEHRNYSEQEKQ